METIFGLQIQINVCVPLVVILICDGGSALNTAKWPPPLMGYHHFIFHDHGYFHAMR